MPMPSFDIVSEVNFQEVDNALNQAIKEVAQRYDFRDAQASLGWAEDKKSIVLKTNNVEKLAAAKEILQGKLVKRGVALNAANFGEIEAMGGQLQKQLCTFQQGIPVEKAREITKLVKDSKLKVQAAIQGEQLRVTGKARDDLQAAMALVRGANLDFDVQFTNFRD